MKIKNTSLKVVAISAIFSLSYAILRYNIFGPVAWKDLPFYILNKAISLTAIILFTISYIQSNSSAKDKQNSFLDNRVIIEITSLLIVIHVLMSLMLFKAEIFEKFFEKNGTISLLGGLSMISGIISLVLLWAYKLNPVSNNNTLISLSKALNVAMLFVVLHLFFMGYKGWIRPSQWNGAMPPISLIAFIISSLGLILKLFRKLDNKTAKSINEKLTKKY